MSSFLNNLNENYKAIVSAGDFALQTVRQTNYKFVMFLSDENAVQDNVSKNIT